MTDTRQDPTGAYPFLTSLDMTQLEALLKTDYSGSMSQQASEEFIDAIIEVMLDKERKEPSGRFPDTEKAWTDFQTYYNAPGRKRPQLFPVPAAPAVLPSKTARSHRTGRLLRRCAAVAAAIGLFMVLLVAAQAAGLDVFGSMARWTDETFHFVVAPAGDETAELRAALREHGIPEAYAPTWVPEGFHAEAPQVSISKNTIHISARFSNGEENFQIAVNQFLAQKCLQNTNYEKDPSIVTSYNNGNQLFYIFENLEHSTATWSNGKEISIEIYGQLSVKDIKSILNSIGG